MDAEGGCEHRAEWTERTACNNDPASRAVTDVSTQNLHVDEQWHNSRVGSRAQGGILVNAAMLGGADQGSGEPLGQELEKGF